MNNQLTIPEEIFSLAVHETGGEISHTNDRAFKVALISALLVNLALEEKIEVDLEGVTLVDAKLTGKHDLDMALCKIVIEPKKRSVRHWIEELLEAESALEDMLLSSLVNKGVLKLENKKVLWVFSSRRYPLIDNKEVVEIRQRVRNLIFSDEIPDPYDVAIISILFYSGIIEIVLDEDEIMGKFKRIQSIAQMDLVGQKIHETIQLLGGIKRWF